MTREEPQELLELGSRQVSPRTRLALVAVAALALALAAYGWVADRGREVRADAAPAPAVTPTAPPPGARGEEEALTAERVAYAVGRTLHVGWREVDVRVGPRDVVVLRARLAAGWLVSVAGPVGRARHGTVDDDGRFRPWAGVTRLPGPGGAVVSPDGTRVVGTVAGRARVLDARTGRPVRALPAGVPMAWTDGGLHLLRDGSRTTRVWNPGPGPAGRGFDLGVCRRDLRAAVVALRGGWEGCRDARLAALSPTGARILHTTGRGASLFSDAGALLEPRVVRGMGPPARQRLDGAAFVGEDQVVLAVTETFVGRSAGALVGCSVTTGACARLVDWHPAALAPGTGFVVLPGCEDEGRRGGPAV